MSGVCDANHNYVLFETGSKNPTRQWYRSENSGRSQCAPMSKEKLKYYVLKNPPSTVQPPPSTVSSLKQLKTVMAGGVTFSVDQTIYDDVVTALEETPAANGTQLRAIIAAVRERRNLPSPIGVTLQSVGLSNYTKRYTYKSADSASQIKTKTVASPNRLFSEPTKSSVYANETYVVDPQGNPKKVTETIAWEAMLLLSNKYIGLFPGKTFESDDGQFMLAADNNGCMYTGDVTQIFPRGTASVFGTTILTRTALLRFYREGKTEFEPFACTLTPTKKSFAPKSGMLVNIKPAEGMPTALLFIPTQSDMDRLQQKRWPSGIGLTLNAI